MIHWLLSKKERPRVGHGIESAAFVNAAFSEDLMSTMTKKMSDAWATQQTGSPLMPKYGDTFRCQKCGMELQITKGCGCKDPNHVRLECCGQAMSRG